MAKLGDLFHIGRLKRRLIAGPLPNPLAFFYFFLVTGFDGLQLAILDSTTHSRGPWGPPAAAPPRWLPSFQPGPGYAPALVLATNLLMFSLILFNLRDVARRTPGGGSSGLRAS